MARDLGDGDPGARPALARRARWARDAHRDSVAGELAFALRTDDDYAVLAERAARKREALAAIPSVAAVEDAEVVSWYFHERLGQEVPPALDARASAHGWGRATELVRALRAEELFTRMRPSSRRRRGTARPARAGWTNVLTDLLDCRPGAEPISLDHDGSPRSGTPSRLTQTRWTREGAALT